MSYIRLVLLPMGSKQISISGQNVGAKGTIELLADGPLVIRLDC